MLKLEFVHFHLRSEVVIQQTLSNWASCPPSCRIDNLAAFCVLKTLNKQLVAACFVNQAFLKTSICVTPSKTVLLGQSIRDNVFCMSACLFVGVWAELAIGTRDKFTCQLFHLIAANQTTTNLTLFCCTFSFEYLLPSRTLDSPRLLELHYWQLGLFL